MQETWVQSMGREDPLEKEMADNSSILAWKVSRTEEPVGCRPCSQKEVGMTEQRKYHAAETGESGHMHLNTCVPKHHHSVDIIYIYEHKCTHMHNHPDGP